MWGNVSDHCSTLSQQLLIAFRFLHASLQLEALQDCTSIYDVRKTLNGFPEQIEDVYAQTWQRILDNPPQKVHLAKRVLLWVLYCPKSMTIAQLRYAVATCPESHRLKAERLVHEATLISICRGLVLVEDSGLVRLVREFLLMALGAFHIWLTSTFQITQRGQFCNA